MTATPDPDYDALAQEHYKQTIGELGVINRAAKVAFDTLSPIDKALNTLTNDNAATDLDPSVYTLNDIAAHMEPLRRRLRDIIRATELETVKVRTYWTT